MGVMAGIIDQLLDFLNANQTDPLTYLFLFFLFSVAAAIFLPIPIEIGLIWNPGVFFPVKALDLGLGKAVGAVAVFYIPSGIRAFARWFRSRHLREVFSGLRAVAVKTGTDKTRPVAFCLSVLSEAACRMGLDKAPGPDWAGESCPAPSTPPPAPSTSTPLRWGWLRWLAEKSEKFTRKYGVIAMYTIMSIPGMIDTVPLYVFSIINKDRTLIPLRDFVLANFLAGINRAFIIFALLEILGISLF